jgi:hypothetical protein
MDDTYAAELKRLGEEQLSDREIARRQIRCSRVCDIAVAGGLKTAADFFYASLVLLHGASRAEYATAGYYARTAAQRGEPRAWSVVAAATDRGLIADGLPQRYGTQFLRVGDRWTVDPVDPQVSDAERAFYAVPPLWVQRKSAAAQRRLPDEADTL